MSTKFNTSNIVRSDSYKVSHYKQYPKGTEHVYSYLESRGGIYDETVMFGLTYYIKEYLNDPITMDDVDEAERMFELHFGDKKLFNRDGWERIVRYHNGYLPVEIKAVSEGTVVPTLNVLLTVENTDPELPWVTNYVETILCKLWYPITVATNSFEIKKLIKSYLDKTGDTAGLDFKLHDFGARGVSSEESAAIGGMAHLINFKGTDTMVAFDAARHFYREPMAGFSIPAAEHSTITSWGRENEVEAFRNMINQFGNGALYAVVSDSYDIYGACEKLWGETLRQEVLDAPGTLVVRPDSGHPPTVVLRCVEILGDKFGYTTNEKGYKVLNKVRVIQGDGIEYESINAILDNLEKNGWSADNLAFGMGGALLQKMDRDTLSFAFKCSAVRVNGEWRDVFKDPTTDSAKVSKRGRLKLIVDGGNFTTVSESEEGEDQLKTVWRNGQELVLPSFTEIRSRVDSFLK